MLYIEIPVRYGREIADPGLESAEANLRYGHLRWRLPTAETALVLVNCWAYFPLQSFVDRVDEICRTKIRPALAACRALGVTVAHAPSPQWAANYREFHFATPPEAKSEEPGASPGDWPPATGEFAVPRTGAEPGFKAWREKITAADLKIAAPVEPAGDDIVVSTGDQLHALCRQRRIKHLLYAGFASNICVLERDYGVKAMKQRGYNIVLLRDGTTAIESSETVGGLWATRSAVFYVELKIGVSTTAADLVEACRTAEA